MNSSTLVQKLWNYCNVLRDDGMSYGDYVEQLTYLLFLKMADERSKPPHNQPSMVPAKYSWPTLLALSGDELFDHYRHTLEALGQQKGTLGLIFGKAQNKFQDPAKLSRVIADLIDKENWSALNVDVKGDAYEGLLEKNAQDLKSGAGQYFTPRALIQAMVTCVAPKPGERICDPACGTEKWSRLFEQLSPIYKWAPGGLPEVQSCPRRRSALATNRPTRWATRGAPRRSCYAACFSGGNAARYFSVGVSRSRLL
jgi:type I restriction enzyme M protein